eukprot:364451-Chlamydomonas_euryale.AAC.3
MLVVAQRRRRRGRALRGRCGKRRQRVAGRRRQLLAAQRDESLLRGRGGKFEKHGTREARALHYPEGGDAQADGSQRPDDHGDGEEERGRSMKVPGVFRYEGKTAGLQSSAGFKSCCQRCCLAGVPGHVFKPSQPKPCFAQVPHLLGHAVNLPVAQHAT